MTVQESFLLWLDSGLLGNEDTIEELSLILITDLARLGDSSAADGEGLVVNTVEDKLVLGFLGELNGAAWSKVDEVTLLSTEEVLDFDLLLVLGDDGVDWEMCMHKSHLVSETL